MGQEIDTPLTDHGIENAYTLGRHLKGKHIEHIFSSDLGRAFITAHIIAENLGLDFEITREPKLREIDFGELTFKHKEDIATVFPQYKKDSSYVYPKGESYDQVQKRAISFISHLEKKFSGKTVLLVSHAGVIRSIICHFKQLPFTDHLKMKVTHEYTGKFVVENGHLIQYEVLHE